MEVTHQTAKKTVRSQMDTDKHQVTPKCLTAQRVKSIVMVALPVMIGYVSIGIPCGILSNSAGFTPWMVGIFSLIFYSGAGQFMAANMLLAGGSILSIIMSVSFINTRQLLYSAALSPYVTTTSKPLTMLFAATVTDESFALNLDRLAQDDDWDIVSATILNLCCLSAWASSAFLGSLLGSLISIPLAVASFAMTSIFICLLCTQRMNKQAYLVIVSSQVSVFVCKCLGLSGVAILVGATIGVIAGLIYEAKTK